MHMRPHIAIRPMRLLPIAALSLFALLLMWRSIIMGDVFLPMDTLLHLHPWRYSYERVVVNNHLNTDPIKQIYPRRVLANTMIKQGTWPLWNHTMLTGTPLLADGQLGLFYPPSLLFLLVPLERAFGIYAFLHLIVAGTGAYAFARRLKLGYGAATLVGTCYMFNGYLLTWLHFPHHTGATAMLPWCFWAVERAWSQTTNAEQGNTASSSSSSKFTSGRYWLLTGIILALPMLSHLQLAFYMYAGAGSYLLARLVQTPSWYGRMRCIAGFSLAVVISLALSAVQFLPAIQLAQQGQRADLGFEPGTADGQFITLLRLVLPALGGSVRADASLGWGPTLLQAPIPYAGLVPLLLAMLSLIIARHPLRLFFGILAIGSFALAVSSPLLHLFMLLIPPYRQFEDHTRWFLLWGFAIAVLAGMGVQALLDAQRTTPAHLQRLRQHTSRASIHQGASWLLVSGTLLFLAVWGWHHLQLFTPQSRYGEYITLIYQQSLHIPLFIGLAGLLTAGLLCIRRLPRFVFWGLLLALVVFDLLWHGATYNTNMRLTTVQPTTDVTQALAAYPPEARGLSSLYPPTRQVTFLQNQPGPFRILGGDYLALPPNLAMTFGLEDIRGYQSLYSERYNRLARLIDNKDYHRTGEGHISFRAYFTSAYTHRRLLDMLNVQYILFVPGSENIDLYAPLELVQEDDEGRIYRNPQVLPRAWLVHQVEVITDDNAQLARLDRSDFDPAMLAIVDQAIPPVTPALTSEITPTVIYRPNAVQVQAYASAPALLVLADAYSADWHVTVDGQPAPLYRANYALRGVWIPAGDHTIVFTYRPVALLAGGVVSLTALLILVGYHLWCWYRAINDIYRIKHD